jgi:hypothetical protein
MIAGSLFQAPALQEGKRQDLSFGEAAWENDAHT